MTVIRKQIRDSQRQEARGAQVHGGRVRPGSGSQVHAKGDVRVARGTGIGRYLLSGPLRRRATQREGCRYR